MSVKFDRNVYVLKWNYEQYGKTSRPCDGNIPLSFGNECNAGET